MAIIANLDIWLGARTEKLTAGLKSAEAKIKSFKTGISGVDAVLSKFSFAAYGSAAAVGALGWRLERAWSQLSRLADASEQIGIDPGFLRGLQAIGDVTGVSATTVEKSLLKMTVRISEAAAGIGEARGVLKALGVDAIALNRAGPEAAFRAITEAINRLPNASDRSRVAVKLFEQEGAGLVRTMAAGMKQIDATRESIDKFAGAIDPNALASLKSMEAEVTTLRHKLDAFFQGYVLDVTQASESVRQGTKGLVSPLDAIFGVIREGSPAAMFNRMVRLGVRIHDVFAGEVELGKAVTDNTKTINEAGEALKRYAEDLDAINKELATTEAAHAKLAAERGAKIWDEMISSLADIETALRKPLSPMETFLEQQRELNRLFSFSVITLQKRNALLARSFAMHIGAPAEERRRELMGRGADVIREFRTPFEAFADRMRDLSMLFRAGAIDPKTYGRALAAAQAEFARSAGMAARMTEPVHPAAVERGTQEAFAAFMRARGDLDKSKETVAELRKHTAFLKEMTRRALVLKEAKLG